VIQATTTSEEPFPVVDMGDHVLVTGDRVRYFMFGECRVFIARERKANGRKRYHLSMSHPTRPPTWDEIREARYRFCPDRITMAMLLPPKAFYVNIAEVWQLWEVDDVPTL
jgi:hypothetical protein